MAENRRSFLKWCTHGLGAIFGLIFGAPVVAYLIDPRHRAQAKAGDFREAQGVDLEKLIVNKPTQGVIRAVRSDAWTLYPSDVLGRVYVILKQNLPEGGAQNIPKEQIKDYFTVLSTTCPHLGCFVNETSPPNKAIPFTCPCHDGKFQIGGERVEKDPNNPRYENPAPRGMDALECKVEGVKLFVKWEKFKQAVPEAEKHLRKVENA